MQIFERLKRYREMSRLRAMARRAPSPASFGALAERHVAHGELERALDVAERGLQRFPDSLRLDQIRIFAKKKTLATRIRSLRQEASRHPTPHVFTSLAEIHRELGNEDEALEIADRAASMFPQNAQPFLIQGEIRLERFLRDQVARDAVQAEFALQRVVRVDPQHMKAHVLLAELYHLVGAIPACRRHLREVLEHSPSAKGVRDYLRLIGGDGAPPTSHDATEEMLSAFASRVEESGVFAGPPEAFPQMVAHTGHARRRSAMTIDVKRLSVAVERFGHTPGVQNATLMTVAGDVLAQHTARGGLGSDDFAELVRDVRTISDDASRRMDAGVLVRAELEGPDSRLTIVRMRQYTIATLFSDPLRTDRVWEMLQDISANCLTSPREVVHA